jgi:uncharacterized protein YdbL (DUF1318 family)
MKQLIKTVLIALLTINMAYALDLQQAKSAGLVGERIDGYLGYVVSPPSAEVSALVKEVNNKRRASFIATANDNGISVEKVSYRFHQLAVEATKGGHYYQDASGNWIKK